jgi:hypothetical protein
MGPEITRSVNVAWCLSSLGEYLMHDAAIEFAESFCKIHSIPVVAWGKKGHRCRGLKMKRGMYEFNLGYEERELPDLGIHYRGDEGQFITEAFTLRSFPDLSKSCHEALSDSQLPKSSKKKADAVEAIYEEYSLQLTKRYCRILERRWSSIQ